ncbi:MAG: hypothetical protein WC683_10045 [bacterium]
MTDQVGRYQLASQPVVMTKEGPVQFATALRFDTVTGLLEVIEVPRPEEPKIKPAKILDLPSGRVS